MEYTPRRKLTREFKLEAVRQAALSEKPKAQLARELGVRVGQSANVAAGVREGGGDGRCQV
jgi:transposase-like protein